MKTPETPLRSETALAVAEVLARSSDSTLHDQGATSRQWQSFVGAGWPWAAVSEVRGGAGGSVDDAADILREVGRAGAAVPAGETDLLGEWLLRQADLPSPAELLAVAPGTSLDDLRIEGHGDAAMLTGTAHRVPWASASERFVALVSDGTINHVVCIALGRLTIVGQKSLAGEARDSVTANGILLAHDEARAVPSVEARDFRARGAASRVLLIQGAVDAIVDLVDSYCTTRTQFGRRLRDFQVVGHQLALLREHRSMVAAAAGLAVDVLNGVGSWEEAAAAKIAAGEIATYVAKTAHQLHGAIGVSEEYALHRFTQRLWAWRDEYGGEHEWATRLGTVLLARGAEALWPWMTRSPVERAMRRDTTFGGRR